MPDSSTLTHALVPTASEPWFSCLRSDAGGVVCVAAVGELDIVGAPHLERALHGAEAHAELVVVDLRELEFMDAGGAQVLLAADERIRSAGARLVVVPGPAQVQRLLALIGFDRELEFVDQPFGSSPSTSPSSRWPRRARRREGACQT